MCVQVAVSARQPTRVQVVDLPLAPTRPSTHATPPPPAPSRLATHYPPPRQASAHPLPPLSAGTTRTQASTVAPNIPVVTARGTSTLSEYK